MRRAIYCLMCVRNRKRPLPLWMPEMEARGRLVNRRTRNSVAAMDESDSRNGSNGSPFPCCSCWNGGRNIAIAYGTRRCAVHRRGARVGGSADEWFVRRAMALEKLVRARVWGWLRRIEP